MIKFSCKKCGQKLNVEDKHSGKRVKCPKCGSIGVVPDNSDKIKFNCKNCGQRIIVPQIHAGKKGKCPKCKNPVVVPSAKKRLAEDVGTFSIVCSMCDETIQVPETSRGQAIECPACGSYIETSSGGIMDESDTASPPTTDEENYEGDSEEYEGSEGMDRRLILIISGVAAVVVVGLIILVTVILPSGPKQIEEPVVTPRQEVGDTDLRSRPATSETQSTKPIVQEPTRKESLPKEPVSLRDKLPAQTKIAFTSGKGRTSDIYIMNADGSEQENLTNNPALNETPCWSPDGTKIAFTSNRDGENNSEIYVMNADGSDPVNLTNNPAKDSYPSWSPDGEKIAFSSLREKKPGIYIMYADGSEQMRLTTEMDFYPCFSPDGAKMAFTSYRGTERKVEIYVMNADGSKQTRLTNNSARDMYPCFSPDGKKIAFTSYRDGGSNSEIYIMNVDGSQQTRITNNPKWDLAPCWSPDGKKIAFSSNRDQTNEIYVMNADGSGIRRLTCLPASDSFPSWSPFLASQSRLATVASDEVGGLNLKLQLKPKQKHNMRIIEDNNTSQKDMGQSFDNHQTKTTELEFEVETVDADNIASIKVTYMKLKEKYASQGGQMEYDSTNPEISADNPFAPTYSAMIGQGFIMKVSPEGKILALSGIDEMYLKMAEKIADSEDEGIRERLKERAQQSIDRTNQRYGSRTKRVEALKEMIKKNPLFGEWRFKELVTHVIVPFSGKSIMTGDSWQAGVLRLPLIPDEIEGTYALKEKNQTGLTIDIGSKIDIDNVTVPAMGSLQGQTKITLKGSYEGSLQIEQDSGWMIRKKATFKADGEMKIAVNQQMPRGMTTPMSIESIVTVEPIE